MTLLAIAAACAVAVSALASACVVASAVRTQRAMRQRTDRARAEYELLTTDAERTAAFWRLVDGLDKIERNHGRK